MSTRCSLCTHSTLAIDGVKLAEETGVPFAVLARAKKISVELSAGLHVIEVRSCQDRGLAGFFVRRLD